MQIVQNSEWIIAYSWIFSRGLT